MIGRGTQLAGRAARLMTDTVVITTEVSGSQDAAGIPTSSETSVTSTCRYVATPAKEGRNATTQVPDGSGALYLPLGVTVTNLTRLRLTHRDGVALATPVRLQADGAPDVQAHYILLPVRLEVQ